MSSIFCYNLVDFSNFFSYNESMKISYKNILLFFKNYVDLSKVNQDIINREYTEEEIGEAFGYTVKVLRTHKGLSLQKLAQEVDMQNPTINRYENGLRIPSITQAIKLADYFNLPIELMILFGLAGLEENLDITIYYDKIQTALQEAQRQVVIDRARKKR